MSETDGNGNDARADDPGPGDPGHGDPGRSDPARGDSDGGGDRIRREVLVSQLQTVLQAIHGATTYPPGPLADMEYVYVEGRLLVRDVDLERALAVVPGTVVDQLVNGLTAYEPTGRTVPDALAELDGALGVGVVTPDHIFSVTPVKSMCPATEPTVAGTALPDPPAAPEGGRGTVVSVVDTGLISSLTTTHAWLAGVTGEEEPYDPTAIGPYVGHGTFVAGVLRCMAPQARVHVEDLLDTAGAVTESGMLMGLTRALRHSPDVISMSAGGTTRHDLPPLGFVTFWNHTLQYAKGTVLVAAAGNNGDRTPFWPAAFPWAVSVGALERDGRRADFSDHGSWVDVYALGRDVVNAYPNGTYPYREPPRVGEVEEFTNSLCSWSGTSFSTPLVAGMVAARMARTGQNGRAAADSILRLAAQDATPGVGPVALPARAGDPDPRGW